MRWTLAWGLALTILLLTGCNRDQSEQDQTEDGENYNLATEIALLDTTFRIDIKDIQVIFDVYPSQMRVNGLAKLKFVMRPGQVRPLVHFDPAINANAVDAIVLNGEPLSFSNSQDVKVLQFTGSFQKAIEFQRDLPSGTEHTLEMSYHLTIPGIYPGFHSIVEDGIGRGNEERFPTINTPGELAHHKLTFRIHEGRRYQCVGSGLIRETATAPIQEWTQDTGRDISSYTLFFVLLPEDDAMVAEREIAGVPVRIMSYKSTYGEEGTAEYIEYAFADLESFLPAVTENIGPYPAPVINLFLANSGGMEFYGGAVVDLSCVDHELFHNYFACSAIARTYRDSWWDEAITYWYVDEYMGELASPIAETYRSNIVSGRSPIAVGWDSRAYEVGASIFQNVAERLGGNGNFVQFLSHLHRTRQFIPMNAMEIADELQAYAGIDMHEKFLRWLYSYENDAPPEVDKQATHNNKVNIDPPAQIMNKYIESASRKQSSDAGRPL